MTFLQASILFVAAILGGTLNSVAGGGTFITLPALIFTGVLPINANASSTVALWPGSIASVWAYRKEFANQRRLVTILLSITSLIGGILGAELLVRTSQTTFVKLLPYLLLLATVLFALSGPINTRLHGKTTLKNRQSWLTLVGISFLQLIIAIYGGYFGGGIGILMLATLGLMGMENIHEMNAMKTLLTTFINGVAVIIFIIRGIVVWPQAIVMVIGAIIGGYTGAYFARKIDQRLIRGFVILVGVSMTIYFFLR
ncbi:MAG: sulfite exporter TauE/SafE family protein [Chloroflexi bacterium]|nr:MAG: hypothetical protein AUI01_10315 [Ktedonobacter sp. 13_2_20CM_2_56_8]TMB83903.1 MAG: sulfite exporter TauE/SafE family protein [Chloroflexota bacterium]